LNNNQIKSIADICLNFPKLHTLILMNNQITDFRQIRNLKTLKGLRRLYLIGNPITESEFYYEKVILILP